MRRFRFHCFFHISTEVIKLKFGLRLHSSYIPRGRVTMTDNSTEKSDSKTLKHFRFC